MINFPVFLAHLSPDPPPPPPPEKNPQYPCFSCAGVNFSIFRFSQRDIEYYEREEKKK